MATNETQANASHAAPPVAKEPPTEQQVSQPGAPKRFAEGQTVCNEKNEKGKLCNGHLKETSPINVEARKYLRGDDLLYKCQSCGALYMGPTLGHVRDPFRQRRYVMSEQNAILLAAGGTLPAFRRTETGALVPATDPAPHATPAKPAAAAEAAAKPAAAASTPVPKPPEPADETPEQKRARKLAEAQARKANAVPIPGASGPPPEGETPEQKLARLQAVVAEAKRRKEAAGGEVGTAAAAPPRTTPTAATTAGTDSSPAADAHRPAAEAQAATGQASAVPLSPAAATASPAAGAETISDLALEASTEMTPGAPADERPQAARPAARRAAPTAPDDRGMPLPPPHLAPSAGETHEQKIERLRAVVAEAKRRAGKE